LLHKGESRCLGWAAHVLGSICWSRGDMGEAKRFYLESATSSRRLGDAHLAALSAQSFGFLKRQQCHWQESSEWFAEPSAIWQKLGNREGAHRVLRTQAIIEWKRGRLLRAEELCKRSLEGSAAAGDKRAEAYASQLQALIDLHAGNFELARDRLVQTLSF